MTVNHRGFTLVELMVVIMLIGILAAIGVPSYINALENNKAEDAASITNMLGTANRMYALDHAGTLASGAMDGCEGTTTCTGSGGSCDLVGCKYMSSMDFTNYSYILSVGGSCGGIGAACAQRRTSGNNSTTNSPYTSWGYAVDTNGIMTESGGAPTPSQ